MALTETPAAEPGRPAPDFSLSDTQGRRWTLADSRGPRGTLVMFICNHCPYVKASIERIVRDCRDLLELGVTSVAIMSNDFREYREDRPEEMDRWSLEKQFPFPYLLDADQAVARAYGAVCTPDFFGFDADLRLAYRGRLDAGTPAGLPNGARRELFEAMRAVAETGRAPDEQRPSMGCSIKWRGD
jgi:peroxiredoxin